jgi:hypothetical protein
MRVGRGNVLLLLCVLGSSSPVSAQTCVSRLPRNINPGMLNEELVALLESSPTFQAQCTRLAAAPWVRIQVHIAPTVVNARARTTIVHDDAGALNAVVQIGFGEDYRELLAHEFEHVLEQLDRIDLRKEVERGAAWVAEDGAFETRRAWSAGVQVARESEALRSHAAVAQWTR